MNKKIIIAAVVVVAAVLIAVAYLFSQNPKGQNSTVGGDMITGEFKDASLEIEGKEAAYFGNGAEGDLNGDGRPDKAFVVTQSGGGEGLLYYVRAALQSDEGYKMTNDVFLGDRIAPEPTEIKEGKLLVKYGESKGDGPMVVITRTFRVNEGGQLTE